MLINFFQRFLEILHLLTTHLFFHVINSMYFYSFLLHDQIYYIETLIHPLFRSCYKFPRMIKLSVRTPLTETWIPRWSRAWAPTKPIEASIVKLQATSIRHDVTRDKGRVAQQISKTGRVSVFIPSP